MLRLLSWTINWGYIHWISKPNLVVTFWVTDHILQAFDAYRPQIILFWYITFGQVGELLSVSEQQLVDCAKGSCSVSSFFVLNIIISNCYYPAVWDVNATIWFWDQTINHTTARCFAGTFFWKSTAKMSFCSLMTILGRQHGKRLGQSKGRDYEWRGLPLWT